MYIYTHSMTVYLYGHHLPKNKWKVDACYTSDIMESQYDVHGISIGC